jgi:hypothetical protein
MGNGQWTVDSGQWTVENGKWKMENKLSENPYWLLAIGYWLFGYLAIWLLAILIATGCQETEKHTSPISPAQQTTGKVQGSISPITAHDAEVLVFQSGNYLKTVKVKDGAFEVKDLAPGYYHLMVVATGFFTNITLKSVEVKAGEVTDVGRVVLLQKVELGWESPRISGKITDAGTKLPIVQANVRVECGDGVCFFDSKSDDEGRYIVTVWPDLLPILTISKAGYKSFGKEFAPMRRGERHTLDVELEKL